MPDLDPTTMCSVVLRAHQWETVLTWLGKGPYEIVAPLIQSIVPQVMRNGMPEVVEHIPAKTNGADPEGLSEGV